MDFKQIIIGHLKGLSIRSMARATGIARNTISRYVKTVKESSHAFEELSSMDNAAIERLFLLPQETDLSRYDALLGSFEKMPQNHKKPGVTSLYHYKE